MSKHSIVFDEHGNGTVTLTSEGEVIVVDHTHPNFTRIAKAVLDGEDPGKFLSIAQTIADLDERVVVLNDTVFFDGQPQDNALTRTILRYQSEGRDTANLVKFMERLAENPSLRGREVIFEWVADKDLVIREDGYFLGWKGVGSDMLSVNSGTAYVDGVKYEGRIPNEVGSVVSMPRTEVMDDPNQDCHIGLHVGTYAYASGYGQVLLEVAVDPADVVSVPAHSTSWKIRCCKYEVVAIHTNEDETFDFDYEPEAEFDDIEADEVLAEHVPESFLSRLRSKLGRSKDDE